MEFAGKKLILAPMAGITDTVFRSLCRKHGADIVVTEMVSVEAVYRKATPCFELMDINATGHPAGIQLFGSDPDKFACAAAFVEENTPADFIDLNCGCPVIKVVKKNGGAALLRDEDRYARIITAMVNAVSLPVTVKIRSGWEMHAWVDVSFARIAEACGAAAVTVHPRSRTMGFSGHSFWERIAEVKNAVSIPVVGNGDIQTPEDGLSMFEQTGCDSIMIGRAAYGNPWIFSMTRAALTGKAIAPVSQKDKIQAAAQHLDLYIQAHGECRAAREMKKHIAWYLKGIPGAAELRRSIFQSRSTDELRKLLFSIPLNTTIY
ncbi:MAG: tRNA dihydrouridine synthase DusB [Chitinivibrionales bacterium]|nr:tRNA dihydrouridine synthase DusB [Chitinivibrionales bacterium]